MSVYPDEYDPDLHGELKAPPADRAMAIVLTLAVTTAIIGVIAWLMIP